MNKQAKIVRSADVFKKWEERVWTARVFLSIRIHYGSRILGISPSTPFPTFCVCVCVCADVPDVKENECVAGRIDSYQLICSEKILLTWLGEVANGEAV